MTETTNYQLSQWEAEDRVLRTDFNADNAKIDAALGALSSRLALLERAVPNLAHFVGQLGLSDILRRQLYINSRAMICEEFLHDELFYLSGSARAADGVVTVSGNGSTGTITSGRNLSAAKCTQARLWVHYLGGTVAPKLNGEPMEPVYHTYSVNVSGEECWFREFLWNGIGKDGTKVTLDLTSNSNTMKVFDFCVMVF